LFYAANGGGVAALEPAEGDGALGVIRKGQSSYGRSSGYRPT
jgi:hypothetical protein